MLSIFTRKILVGEIYMDGTIRTNISLGLHVAIILKKDQKTGKLTRGIVQRILTNSRTHPHGIKVRLESGEIGRVKEILD
ncbi:MAG: putative protein YwbE [Candidatus Methanomarinus sp.]|jgi:uncharacterized repeat protein (TIGR03833 family)|nr:MAG: putative protein YwbE [ANME-2 cluster archaeon]